MIYKLTICKLLIYHAARKHKQEEASASKAKNPGFSSESTGKRNRAVRQGMLLLPLKTSVNDGLKENVICAMKPDRISLAAQNDPLIIRFAEYLYDKYGARQHLHQHISCKMREFGRFLIAIKSIDKSVTQIRDCNQINLLSNFQLL